MAEVMLGEIVEALVEEETDADVQKILKSALGAPEVGLK